MGGSTLVRNTLWNLWGFAAPVAVAVFCIPVIVRALGTEKFGVLNLAWMVIGYFTLFDLGLGRALTKLVAEKLGNERRSDLPSLVWTASALMLAMGIVGAIVLGVLSPFLVAHTFKVPAEIREETLHTFYLLAAAVPLVISTTGLRGILEAHQRFAITSVLRVSMGVFTFLGPLLVLPFSRDLFWITFALVTGRLLAWFCHLLFCFHIMPELKSGVSPKRSMVRPLLAFGGWLTVSNVISPVMVSLDRFLIGAMISMTAVAYYSTPWEIVTKFLVIPGSVVAVFFPAFSALYVLDSPRADRLYRRGLSYLFFVMFPLIFLVVIFAKEGLNYWLGAEFAENGFRVLQLLAIGILVNGLASMPFAFIQGAGRPDVTAKFHMAEAMFYFPCAWFLIKYFGVTGAALAWVLRAGADACALFFFAEKFLVGENTRGKSHIVFAMSSIGVLILAMISFPIVLKLPLVLLVLTIFVLATWRWGVDVEEKAYINDKAVSFLKLLYSRQ